LGIPDVNERECADARIFLPLTSLLSSHTDRSDACALLHLVWLLLMESKAAPVQAILRLVSVAGVLRLYKYLAKKERVAI